MRLLIKAVLMAGQQIISHPIEYKRDDTVDSDDLRETLGRIAVHALDEARKRGVNPINHRGAFIEQKLVITINEDDADAVQQGAA